ATVCVALLENLQARGLDISQPVLLVLDGAKALHAAAKRVWGQHGVIQRGQVHKKHNVKAHVPQKHHAELERRLSEAYHETGYEAAKASVEATARWLERINPDAAASLRKAGRSVAWLGSWPGLRLNLGHQLLEIVPAAQGIEVRLVELAGKGPAGL